MMPTRNVLHSLQPTFLYSRFADYESTALAGIEAMEDFFRSIHMPTNLRELASGPPHQQIHELAFKCSFEDTRTIGVFKQLNMKDMEKIYMMARETFQETNFKGRSSSSSSCLSLL